MFFSKTVRKFLVPWESFLEPWEYFSESRNEKKVLEPRSTFQIRGKTSGTQELGKIFSEPGESFLEPWEKSLYRGKSLRIVGNASILHAIS